MMRVLAGEPLTLGINPLDADEGHHLEVRRAGGGDRVEVVDGHGGIGIGVLGQVGRAWQVEVTDVRRIDRPADLVLVVGAGDRDRFFWLTEKAVEVGVTRIVPVDTERSRHVATRLRAEHREKLERRAAEALKQCGGAWKTTIDPPRPLADVLAGCHDGARWLADQAGDPPGSVGVTEPVTIAVGPEGGFSVVERNEVIARGFHPIRVGGLTMRFETAAIVVAAVAGLCRKESS